ncbi:7d2453ca-1636-4f09-a44c-930f8bdddb60 [Sclerotinia trifoliorum]|uniref:7d2453ca-1636-4f09-a44c-930f8bdddb60 n=1 Tax=Sclerotinia trifoliorum TaxID=28548 RepID=A0A8H2VPR3_9HELO|nr:7d2453ca-1636-4f09-a44c-930f8bdddb60 [Sclerotinia trifoliorum]
MVVDSVPKHLDTLVRDRDGPYCTMTMSQASDTSPAPKRVESAHVIPPSILRDIETAEGGRLISVLEAFISTSHVHRLRTLLSDSVEDNAIFLQNIWLLSPSMHKAFRAGHIEVRKIDQSNSSDTEASQTEMYRVKGKYPERPRDLYFGNGLPFSRSQSEVFSISTTDPRDVPLPSDFLFDIHRRFSSALHLFSIEDKISHGWPKPTISILQNLFRFPISVFKRAFHSLWLWTPASVRLRCYRHLWTIGERLYGPEEVQWVQRVPFGLYIKETQAGTSWNESNAVNMIERYTSIPAPRSVDVVKGSSQGLSYLVMTRLQGESFRDSFHLMSYAERNQFIDDVGECVSQMREIPRTTSCLFSDTLGGPMYDHLIPNRTGGPFNNELELNAYMYSEVGGGQTLAEIYGGKEKIPSGHQSVFTHSDFHYSNLLVDWGRFCGIIDWECAGFKPEYWEFTHAGFGSWGRKYEMSLWRRIFGNQYDEILEMEEKRWRYNPIF